MKNILSTSLITFGAITLATGTAAAQVTITPLPAGFDAFELSPIGGVVSGQDNGGVARYVGGVVTNLPGNGWDLSFAGHMNFDGSMIAGRVENPLSTEFEPSFWQLGVGNTSLGYPLGGYGGTCLTSTASSISWDGTVIGGNVALSCNVYPFRWTTTNGFQILDTTSPIVPAAQPSAKVHATSGDGLVSAGWIQSTNRSGAVWDQAGVLSFPFITPANTDGLGEIHALNVDGTTVAGESSFDGPVVVRDGVIHSVAVEAGLAGSGEGMLSLSADGSVGVGAGGGQPGPFGSPDTGLIWTAWSGGQDINAFFAAYGVTLPTGNPIVRGIGVSLDAHTFLVSEASFGPFPGGYGDAFMITLPNSWANLGGNSPTGQNGIPQLTGQGYLTDGAPARVTLAQAASNSIALVAVSGTDNSTPLWGGVLHTLFYTDLFYVPTDATGNAVLDANWPSGLAGATLYVQAASIDATVPDGFTLTNALSATGY